MVVKVAEAKVNKTQEHNQGRVTLLNESKTNLERDAEKSFGSCTQTPRCCCKP